MKRFNKSSIGLFLVFGLFPPMAMAQLPDPGLAVEAGRTAVVITDPQNDFLSPDGVTWGLVGASVEANGTVANIASLMTSAKAGGFDVFISPLFTICQYTRRLMPE